MAEPVHRPVILRLSGRTLGQYKSTFQYYIVFNADIRDLKDVIRLLERHHYNKASYHRLGLSLLLSHNTLRSIEQEHRGQVDRCCTECLASWLRKVDGGNPTINILITALREIGENAVADSVTGERQSNSLFSDKFLSLSYLDIIAASRGEIPDRLPTSEGECVSE